MNASVIRRQSVELADLAEDAEAIAIEADIMRPVAREAFSAAIEQAREILQKAADAAGGRPLELARKRIAQMRAAVYRRKKRGAA